MKTIRKILPGKRKSESRMLKAAPESRLGLATADGDERSHNPDHASIQIAPPVSSSSRSPLECSSSDPSPIPQMSNSALSPTAPSPPSSSRLHPELSSLEPDLTSTILDPMPANGDESNVRGDQKPQLSSTSYSGAKAVIEILKEVSDIFPPLKAIASALFVSLKNYDVSSS